MNATLLIVKTNMPATYSNNCLLPLLTVVQSVAKPCVVEGALPPNPT